MRQKSFYCRKLPLLLGIWFLLASPCALAATNSPPVSASKAASQVLTGFDRHYNISFLWFDRLAAGQLSLARDSSAPNRFRAFLDAKTLGIAGWLTGDRMQHYETLMEMTPQGRLVPLEYRVKVLKKKGGKVIEYVKHYTFDSRTRTIKMTRSRDGKRGVEKPVKILGNRYPVDFLTAGFNYILGADGPLQAGERKDIFAFTDEGERKIVIEVLRAEEWPKISLFGKGKGTLLKIILPPEILDTDGGAVYALLDEKLLPQQVIVENVLGMGNVIGELRQ